MKLLRSIPLAACLVLAAVPAARAQVVYQIDGIITTQTSRFNNSQGTETEDNWVANSFQVIVGGTRLTSITQFFGTGSATQPATVAIYRGSSLTNPQAGTGLTRVNTTTTTIDLTTAGFKTINLTTPQDFAVGDIFYAAMLLPGIAGNVFPLAADNGIAGAPAPLGRSFFDVGATQGAAYNLDVTLRATVLGGTHPVVGAGVQSAGNLGLRVNAVPEPGSFALVGFGVTGMIAVIRRRRRVAGTCQGAV